MEPHSVDVADGEREVASLFAQQNVHQVATNRIKELPPAERSQALNDLHGVPDPLEEDAELLLRKMRELDNTLLFAEQKEAYEEAAAQSHDYVNEWKLRFLRAERFNCNLAAERMTKHFEAKRAMFGSAVLGRDLSLNDLSKPELTALRTGVAQVLSHRDRGGRAIFIEMATMDEQWPIETVVKLQFLLASLASEDEEVQKKGVVLVFYAVGRSIVYTDRVIQDVGNWSSWPLRLVGIHACYDNPDFHEVITMASHAMQSKYVCRHQSHFGTHVECQSNLELFGIPRHAIPLYPDGSIDCTHHLRWIQHAQQGGRPQHHTAMGLSDHTGSNQEGVILMVGPLDVIMGRGQRKHIGNKRLKRLLERHLGRYDGACKLEKRRICQQLVQDMTNEGTRFIKPVNSGGWERIGDDGALDKISHGFRDVRREYRRNTDLT